MQPEKARDDGSGTTMMETVSNWPRKMCSVPVCVPFGVVHVQNPELKSENVNSRVSKSLAEISPIGRFAPSSVEPVESLSVIPREEPPAPEFGVMDQPRGSDDETSEGLDFRTSAVILSPTVIR